MAEADAAEAEAARVARRGRRARRRSRPSSRPKRRELRAAEDALHDADTAHRGAEAEASRWRARAEMLRARARRSARGAPAATRLADLDGVLGPLVDLLEIDDGAEIAVAAALGDALKAIVVDGDDAARAAIERLKRGDGQALLLVADGRRAACRSRSRRAGTPSARRVRARHCDPGSIRVLARLLAPFVLVDGGWEHALDVALADPGVDRGHARRRPLRRRQRRGAPVRRGSSVVTPAALADATSRGRRRPKSARDEAERATSKQRASGSPPPAAPS